MNSHSRAHSAIRCGSPSAKRGSRRRSSLEQLALLPQNEADPQSSLFPKISVDDRRRVLADRLVAEARARAAHHRFFHWEIGFPNVWSNLLSPEPNGGFDAVIGNPPYVRQELLGEEVKRALKADYSAYDGMADLYVYFYEQALRLLRPGGRLSYVVTNKWLKAGYAEALRDLFASTGQVEFVADFGHARHFFPDADVFPSVVVVRRPVRGETVQADPQVCVIPRDAVPEKGLSAAVAAATYQLPRAHFTKASWTLEPPDVVALLDKIRRNGVPLAEYAGVKPLSRHHDRLQRGLSYRHADARPTGEGRSRLRRYHQAVSARSGHRAMVVTAIRPSHDCPQIERRPQMALGQCA